MIAVYLHKIIYFLKSQKHVIKEVENCSLKFVVSIPKYEYKKIYLTKKSSTLDYFFKPNLTDTQYIFS